MNWRKAALWGLGGMALLGIAGAVALHLIVDPERLKKVAADHARTAWERELLMQDVSLQLFPLPALQAVKVTFANPPWSRQPHLLQADYVRADLELLPLLMGQVRVKSLTLEGARAALEESADGKASWELRHDPAAVPREGQNLAEVRIKNLVVTSRSKDETGAPWHIDEARVEADPGYRNVRIDAKVTRHGQPLALEARLADLSRLGVEGAVSEGKVDLRFAKTRATLEGRFPLQKDFRGHAVRAELKSDSVQDLFAFFGIERRPTAPLALRFETRDADGRLAIDKLGAKLGTLQLAGDGNLEMRAGKPVVRLRLDAERLDWLKTLVEAGGTLKPRRKDEEVFHADPVAWRVVTALGAIEGTAFVTVKSLRLGNGLELANTKSRLEFGDGRMAFGPFTTEMLGGTASGTFKFDGRKKTIDASLEGRNLLLEQWFRQRGSKVPFTGGPMQVTAAIRLAGDTYRELAASASGPVRIRMGKGSWNSRRAGEYEEIMVSALAAKQSDEIEFECAAADLDFRKGRASGSRLIGARSNVSQLLTDGFVDLREETIDLRGKVKARSGATVGLAMFAGEVQIHGKLARPKMRADPDAKPAVIARAAAAVASAGATLIGGALIDAAEKDDPCRAVLR